MNVKDVQVFIDCTLEYFKKVTGTEAVMGVPYMKTEKLELIDYTGLIGITGKQKGGVYFSTSTAMIQAVTGIVLGQEETAEEDLYAMIGEIANTISGNVRTVFGPNFMISVPVVVKGRPETFKFQLKPPTFVIPFTWQGHDSLLVVGVD